jgi:curved DNA-binding protein CbpA
MAMDSFYSFYEILSVPDDAGLQEIKSSFRKLALQYHPDQNENSPESEAKFKLIHNAYGILADPVKRAQYDQYLATSSGISTYRKTARTALPGKTDARIDSRATLLGHFNFLLWDVEDLLRYEAKKVWNREYSGMTLGQYVLKILTFIDQWVLEPAGYPDYFLEARKLSKINAADYVNTIGVGKKGSGHHPFVGIPDYFYNIRKRMNGFLNEATPVDLVKTIPDLGLRMIDCLFEAQNLAIHYLNALQRVLAEETDEIEPYQYSDSRFRV